MLNQLKIQQQQVLQFIIGFWINECDDFKFSIMEYKMRKNESNLYIIPLPGI